MSETATLTTLRDFLIARIKEDEAWFQRAKITGGAEGEAARFARWVLAECEAKRQIMRLHRPQVDETNNLWCGTCLSPESHYGAPWPCPTFRALAAAYADHPDYREEWKP